MKIKIKRIDKSIPLPEYKTGGAAAIDLYCRENIKMKPKETVYIPLNNVIQFPKGYWGLLVARSSAHKLGVSVLNGIGVIDSDYSGNLDEIKGIFYNFTDSEVLIKKGDRVAQIILMKHENFELEEVTDMENDSRGGIGSTGNK